MAKAKNAKALRATPQRKGGAKPAENVEAEKVREPLVETLSIPAALLLAAETVAAKADKTKPYMQGVLIHQKDAKQGRVVSFDGYRLFVGAFAIGGKVPSWLKDGMMLAREDLKTRISMLVKVEEAANVSILTTKGSGIVQLADPRGRAVLQVPLRNHAGFPDYDKMLSEASFTALDEEGMPQGREWKPVGFNSRHLKHCGEVAKILEAGLPKEARSKTGLVVRAFDAGDDAPRVFDFDGWPGVILVMGQVRVAAEPLPIATANLLAPAVRLTVAALRAHATRWTQRAAEAKDQVEKVAAEARAESFQARIAEIMRRSGLPQIEGSAEAEKPEAKPEAKQAEDDETVRDLVSALVGPEGEEEELGDE